MVALGENFGYPGIRYLLRVLGYSVSAAGTWAFGIDYLWLTKRLGNQYNERYESRGWPDWHEIFGMDN